ncbi:chromate transporter [Neorhizobium sp. P12A]|nr:chromate transporter [Neorhizobium sp. P12A]
MKRPIHHLLATVNKPSRFQSGPGERETHFPTESDSVQISVEIENGAGRTARDNAPQGGAPSLWTLLIVFTKLGVTSIGNGVNGMLHAELVVARRWLSEDEFLSGLAVSQAMPGVNIANLALWLGYQQRGITGALVALTAVVVPPAVIIVLIGGSLLRLSANPVIGALLAGLATAAAGLSLSVGYRAARHAYRDWFSGVLFIAALAGGIVFHFSAIALVGVLAPVGIGIGFLRAWREGR